jgi:GTP-binding protein
MNQIFGTATFLSSSGKFSELPAPVGDEFAILGRSNVGKSSFLNHVCADHRLARTSKRPGTTICVNLFKIAESVYWADLPGYGFARTGGSERERWSSLILDYCEKRENLKGVVWLVDMRHIGVKMDLEAYEWLRKTGVPVLPVLSKADKLSRNERQKQAAAFGKIFGGFAEPVLYSILDHSSRERFWERFAAWSASITIERRPEKESS